jgi:tetratricopeptide (TPR) repeat protein
MRLLWHSVVGMALAVPAFAQDLRPSADNLNALYLQVLADPENLDLNYDYADMAVALGDDDAALAAYERMLMVAPNLPRVKLDMGAVYIRMGNLVEARRLFNEVLATNPPQEVKNTVAQLMDQLDAKLSSHKLSGSLSGGITMDSNANSAAGAGRVTLFDVSIPLDDTSRAVGDTQTFSAATVAHTYTLPSQSGHMWKTEGLLYKTWQEKLGNLNLTVQSVRAGPEFMVPALKGKIGLGLAYSDINLGGFNYLDLVTKDIRTEHVLSDKVMLTTAYAHENRQFKNTRTNSSFGLRTGRANEEKVGLKIALGPSDMLDLGLQFRQEKAVAKYNSNRQAGLTVTHTHIFSNGVFLGVMGALRKTQYKALDPSISNQRIREDSERSYTVSMGKSLSKTVAAIGAYQYKDISSNLQNYDYENDRVTFNVVWTW